MSSESLAQLSNTLVYSAMGVYTAALGAFVTDLAQRGSRLQAFQAPSADATTGGETERGLRASEPALESASVARAAAATAVSHGVPTITEAVEREVRGSDVRRSQSRSGSPARAATVPARVSTVAATAATRPSRAGGIAVAVTALALALHAAAVTARAASVERPPWGNMYEFAISGSVVVTAVFLVVLARRDVRWLGTFVVGPVLLTLGLAIAVFYTEAAELVPALDSVWLAIHVSVAFIACALFTLGFSATVLQLVQERRTAARAAGRTPRSGRFMDVLPSSADLEQLAYRLHVAAFPLWGFTLIAGAIWAEHAWGRYWNWDPKEIWTFVIWVVYAAYLHARATRGWDGRRAAYLAIAGYVAILINFLVVNLFAVGLHSYA
jgi:cytochrome c-type biogenesis protein CcsB